MIALSRISLIRLSALQRLGRLALPSLALLAVLGAATRTSAQSTLPEKLTDAEYWRIVTEFSEPPGYFRSENFTSNETGFQAVIPELKRTTSPGGVYMGVGPEQNFTYIVALQPRLAFITDIRRQNMMQHLIYKVLMEQYDNRADFLSHLFSRPRPGGLDSTSTPDALFTAYLGAAGDSVQYRKNLANIFEQLIKQHGFRLAEGDSAMIARVVTAFYQAGPAINYSFTLENGFGGAGRVGGGRGMVNYAALMVTTDGQGLNRTYLANEANYRQLRAMQLRNAIIPLVGDFGGPKALRAVGTYLKEHKATVTAFYCSNVEQYLFPTGQGQGWTAFYTSIGTLPLDSASTFIRSGGGGGGGRGGGGGMANSLLASMQMTVTAFKAGQINSYQDVLNMSHPPF